jgi:hypothetical protein
MEGWEQVSKQQCGMFFSLLMARAQANLICIYRLSAICDGEKGKDE